MFVITKLIVYLKILRKCLLFKNRQKLGAQALNDMFPARQPHQAQSNLIKAENPTEQQTNRQTQLKTTQTNLKTNGSNCSKEEVL